MPDSTYVFESGEAILVGSHGDHSYVYASGSEVTDKGQSALVFESGVGLGGETAAVTISDSKGESTGDVAIIARAKTADTYYGYNNSRAEGEIDENTTTDYTTFFIFENTDTGEYSIGFVHDSAGDSPTGGDINMSISGLPGSPSWLVQDDPGDGYSLSVPTATIDHGWTDTFTDGMVLGTFTESELQGSTITYDVTKHAKSGSANVVPDTVRFLGDAGTTVERAYDGTNTTVEITFGSTFGN